MNKIKFLFTVITVLFALTFNVFAQDKKSDNKQKPPKKYNKKLAKKLGADDYGMRQYVFVVLKTGKAKITDEKKRQELFAGHFANMGRLAKKGILVLAGPFMEGGEKRGLFIFNVKTIEEAKELVKTDPAIAAGIFEVDITKWYGSAALMKINEIHSKIQKKKI